MPVFIQYAPNESLVMVVKKLVVAYTTTPLQQVVAYTTKIGECNLYSLALTTSTPDILLYEALCTTLNYFSTQQKYMR